MLHQAVQKTGGWIFSPTRAGSVDTGGTIERSLETRAYVGFLQDVPSVANDGHDPSRDSRHGFRRAHRVIFHFVRWYRQCVGSAFPPR
jgi:hypothetical protein